MSNTIDALTLKKAFIAGANNLDKNKEYINELNVFPVPDGDTGTNMTLTILSAVREVEAAPDDMKSIAKAMSTGSLRGARGNSGVILSQLLRGFSKKVQDSRFIDVHDIADAFQKAVETAYKAVMKPKEGTILTVAKGVATKARECADADMSLDTVCSKLGVSNSYFSSIFKKEVGISFITYLTDYRMQQAVHLMLETNEKNYEIAEHVGYEDANYFGYVFKRKYGMSPSKYRTEHMGK